MKITERDKKLLVFLAVAVLLVGFGRFVFYPLLQQISDRSDQQASLELEKEEMEMKLSQKAVLESKEADIQANFDERTAGFYDLIQSQDVDREITQIVLKHGLNAVESSIKMPEEPLEITYYVNSAAAAGNTEQEGTDTSAEDAVNAEDAVDTEAAAEEGGDTQATEEKGVFFAPLVSLTVLGSHEQEQLFLDDLNNNYPSIRVTGYTQKEQEENGVGTGVFSLSVDLEVYTCDKSSLA